MSEFSDMLGYLMYGTDDVEFEDRGTYEEKIESAYDKIFKSLEKIFPSVNEQNEELFNTIMDFLITHNEVYLEMGVIIEIQMYKNIEQQNFGLRNIQRIIKKMYLMR